MARSMAMSDTLAKVGPCDDEIFEAGIAGLPFPHPSTPCSILYFSSLDLPTRSTNPMDYFNDIGDSYYSTSTSGGSDAHLNQIPVPEHDPFTSALSRPSLTTGASASNKGT